MPSLAYARHEHWAFFITRCQEYFDSTKNDSSLSSGLVQCKESILKKVQLTPRDFSGYFTAEGCGLIFEKLILQCSIYEKI